MIARVSSARLARAAALALLLASGMPGSGGRLAHAQEPPDAPEVEAGESEGEAEDGQEDAQGEDGEADESRPSNAPYMQPLGRLSTILGSVHFLRALCGDPDAAMWRQRMSDLLAAQAPNEADRRQLVASFNTGYRAFESTYRRCTPAARLAVARYQSEGASLSREISTRYGN